MRALVGGAAAVAVLATLGNAPPEPLATPRSSPSFQPLGTLTKCPPRSVPNPDGPGCLALPEEGSRFGDARLRRLAKRPKRALELRPRTGAERIGRLPERPASWSDYQLPVDPFIAVTSSDEERLGQQLRYPVRIAADEDSPVTLVDLEGQSGEATVELVGHLDGVAVVTRHRVDAPSGPRDYLVFYGNLARPGPSIVSGARLGTLAVIGFVGRDPVSDEPHLELEVRQIRESKRRPEQLSDLLRYSISCDPRNVLPLSGP